MKKIRILECIRQGQIGGGESHLLSLVENMDKATFDPVVLSFTDGPMIERLRSMNVDTHIIPTLKPFDVSKWKTVKSFIREQEVDIVHAHGTRATSNVLWAARSLRIPVLYTVHGWSFHQDQHPLVRNIRILGEKYLTSRTQLNISVSASNQQSGKKFLPHFQSVVINNGIDGKRFDPERKLNDVRKELNIPADRLLVLFIARFTSHKQPLSLIRAFAEAVRSRPDIHLLMVGDGDQKAEAKTLIESLDLKDRISLLSFRQDVPDVLAAADIFVLPSLWEGLPIGLLEAMSMGKATIATNVDGTSEIIENEKNGLLIDTSNLVQNLAAALVELSGDNERRNEFGREAKRTVSQKYDAAVMTRHIESTYLRFASKKPIPG